MGRSGDMSEPVSVVRSSPRVNLKKASWKIACVLVVLIPLIAFVAGARISSPDQRAAAAKAPEPSVIKAKVEEKTLSETIVINGDVTASNSVDVTADSAGAGGGSTPVVSDVRTKVGDTINEGQTVVVISGRPVIVLQGSVPAYRDLQPGMLGNDVLQLQKALKRLHYSIGKDVDGTYGQGTQTAVGKFYQDRGFSSQMTSTDVDDLREQAKQAVTDAQRQLDKLQQPPTTCLLYTSDAADE